MSGIFGLFDEINEGAMTPEEVNSIMESAGCTDDLSEIKEFAGDLDDAMFQAALENEQNFGILRESILKNEFKVYVESGDEIVYEGIELKQIWAKIKGFITTAWTKVQSVFKKAIDTIKGWITSDKAYVEKYGTKIAAVKSIELKNAYDVMDADTKDLIGWYSELRSSFTKTYGSLDSLLGGTNNKTTEDTVGEFIKAAVGSESVDEFKKELSDSMGTTKKEDTITVSGSAVVEILKTHKTNKKMLEAAFKASKAYFAMMLKTANAVEKAAKVTDKDSENGKAASRFATGARTAISLSNIVNKAAVKVAGIVHSQARKAAGIALATANKKDDKPAATNEGAMFV